MNGEKLPGNWVYGGILQGSGDFSIIYTGSEVEPFEKFVVYSDTVGQYTGLTDKNGVRIFDGDIVRSTSKSRLSNRPFLIEMQDITGGFGYWFPGKPNELQVLGNIHDNPELLST